MPPSGGRLCRDWVSVLVLSTVVWLFSVRLRDASIADIAWGPGFALLAWFYRVSGAPSDPRATVLAWLVTAWAVRLAVHILARHDGEDPRYRSMRAAQGPAFWWRSLFTVFWLQAALQWFVALPLLAAARPGAPAAVTATDAAGALAFAIGFGFEAIADRQLTRFKADPANRGRVLDTGLWRYSRHPNYFGDALLWWGLFLIAAAAPGAWMTVLSPAVMTVLLLRVSGVALLERGLRKSKPGYASYIDRTSAFVPWLPRPARRPDPPTRS